MKSIEALFGKYDFNLDDRKVSDEVQRIIAEEFDSNNNVSVWRRCFLLIDLTSLNSTDTEEKIDTANAWDLDSQLKGCTGSTGQP